VSSDVSGVYRDRWIACTPEAVRIRGYYVPWGTKTIPYTAIRGVRRVALTPLNGGGRIWGTASPRYWASLDPRRMSKKAALVLDLGRFVHPFITPDDVDAVLRIICERTGLTPTEKAG